METYNKESIIAALQNIKNRGWILNARPGNVGGVGNTLEDLLGIQENNLPIPNSRNSITEYAFSHGTIATSLEARPENAITEIWLET